MRLERISALGTADAHKEGVREVNMARIALLVLGTMVGATAFGADLRDDKGGLDLRDDKGGLELRDDKGGLDLV